MKLEVGKYYKSRDGQKWKCVHEYKDGRESPFLCLCCADNNEDIFRFEGNGFYFINKLCTNQDLISEWVEPVEHEVKPHVWKMDLRDWFAGMALQGKMALKGYTGVEEMRKVVSVCYEYADLMLEAREKKE